MYGEKKESVTLNCKMCGEPQTFLVDLEDVKRGVADRTKLVHTELCVDREGKPYLTEYEAEMLCSNTCEKCWKKHCPDDKNAYN